MKGIRDNDERVSDCWRIAGCLQGIRNLEDATDDQIRDAARRLMREFEEGTDEAFLQDLNYCVALIRSYVNHSKDIIRQLKNEETKYNLEHTLVNVS